MEWDAELFGKMDNNFREILLQKSKLVIGASIESQEIINKIKITYRLLLLRDSVLALNMNEKLNQKVSNMITGNYHEIISHICCNKQVISSLFENLRNGEIDSLKMISEICITLKNNPTLSVSFIFRYVFGISLHFLKKIVYLYKYLNSHSIGYPIKIMDCHV